MQSMMRHQAEETMAHANPDSDSTDSESEADFEINIDDGAVHAARRAQITEFTQALAAVHTPEALNAVMQQGIQTAWQAVENAPAPPGKNIASSLEVVHRNWSRGFPEAGQALLRLKEAANASEIALDHYSAMLSVRSTLLPNVGPDLLDQQLQRWQTAACRLRAQEKTMDGLLALRQCFKPGIAGQSRLYDEVAGHLRGALALHGQEAANALSPELADISDVLCQTLTEMRLSIRIELDQILFSGKTDKAPLKLAPPDSTARQPETIEEAWIARLIQSGTALDEASCALLAAWGHPTEEADLVSVAAEGLNHPLMVQGRATQRREAALDKALQTLMMVMDELQDQATGREDSAPDEPWQHTLKVFLDLNRVLGYADKASLTLSTHTADWSPKQKEASREALGHLHANIVSAREKASAKGREALQNSLGSLIQKSIQTLRSAHLGSPDAQAAAKSDLTGLASTARQSLARLEQSGIHPLIACLSIEQCTQIFTAIAQTCDSMVHALGSPAQAEKHAACLQAAEQMARQAGQGELAPLMHELAELCNMVHVDMLNTATALKAEAASQTRQLREAALQEDLEPLLKAMQAHEEHWADLLKVPRLPWNLCVNVLKNLNLCLSNARKMKSQLDLHTGPWSDAQRHESREFIGVLQARIATLEASAIKATVPLMQAAFKEISQSGTAALSSELKGLQNDSQSTSVDFSAFNAAHGLHGAIQTTLELGLLPEQSSLALLAKAFEPIVAAGHGLTRPLTERTLAWERAAILETAVKQAQQAAHSQWTALPRQWADLCQGLRLKAIEAAVEHDLHAIDLLHQFSDQDINESTQDLSDRLLDMNELAFDFPFHFTKEGLLAVTEPEPATETPQDSATRAEDLELAQKIKAIAQRAISLRDSLPQLPADTPGKVMHEFHALRIRLNETVFTTEVLSGLLPLFHEASQAIAQAAATDRLGVIRQFSKKLPSYQRNATEALSNSLEIGLRLNSANNRQHFITNDANVRSSERLVTLMQMNLEGLGEIMQCRNFASNFHTQGKTRRGDIKETLSTVAGWYESAIQGFEKNSDRLLAQLETEGRMPGYAAFAQVEESNAKGNFAMLIWRTQFESSIVQAQFAADWLDHLTKNAPGRAADLAIGRDIIATLSASLTKMNKVTLEGIRHEGNAHLVRKILAVSLDSLQRMKSFDTSIRSLEKELAVSDNGASSSATPHKARHRRKH